MFAEVTKIRPQDPLRPDSTFGALINQAHLGKVLSCIKSGTAEGAELMYGGNQVNENSGGFYLEPTIFDLVNPK